jgi:hypothetical protein
MPNDGHKVIPIARMYLGGNLRTTISLTVIIVECTGDISFGLPIMIVLMISKYFTQIDVPPPLTYIGKYLCLIFYILYLYQPVINTEK